MLCQQIMLDRSLFKFIVKRNVKPAMCSLTTKRRHISKIIALNSTFFNFRLDFIRPSVICKIFSGRKFF